MVHDAILAQLCFTFGPVGPVLLLWEGSELENVQENEEMCVCVCVVRPFVGERL